MFPNWTGQMLEGLAEFDYLSMKVRDEGEELVYLGKPQSFTE